MYEEMCEMFKDRQKIPSVICLLIILPVVAEFVNKVQKTDAISGVVSTNN